MLNLHYATHLGVRWLERRLGGRDFGRYQVRRVTGFVGSSGRAEGSREGADMRGPSGSEIGSSVGLSVCAVSCGSPMG